MDKNENQRIIEDIRRIRRLMDKRICEDPSARNVLKVMFWRDVPKTHCKTVIQVLDRILKFHGDE